MTPNKQLPVITINQSNPASIPNFSMMYQNSNSIPLSHVAKKNISMNELLPNPLTQNNSLGTVSVQQKVTMHNPLFKSGNMGQSQVNQSINNLNTLRYFNITFF
jgi:hypothetical protein